MGGKVRLGLEPSIVGDCTIATMGGSVELVLPESLALRVEAHTMGGKIELDGERLSRDGGLVTLHRAGLNARTPERPSPMEVLQRVSAGQLTVEAAEKLLRGE